MGEFVSPSTYYVEGTDCVGKDTVGLYIADRYSVANVQKLVLHGNNPWDVDRTGELPSGHPLFPAYLIRSIVWDVRHYDPKEDQIQISFTAPRSAAWQLAANKPLASIFEELVKYCPLFEYSILLHASVEAKQRRLVNREQSEGKEGSAIDKLVFHNPDFVRKMDGILIEISRKQMQADVIDTTDLNIEQVNRAVTAMINTRNIETITPDMRTVQRDMTPELTRFHSELVTYVDGVAIQYGIPETDVEKVKLPFLYNCNDI